MADFKGFTPKQVDFIVNGNHRYNIMYGASRSGKSATSLFIIPMKIRELVDKDGINLILGYTRETLTRNVILPLQEWYGTELVSNIHYDNTIDLFGSKAYALGCNNSNAVDRIRGSSVKFCYADELATFPEDVFSMLQSRLDKPYSKFYASLNPTGKNTWVYKLLFEKEDIDLYKQHTTIYDNPTLDKTFVENLEREYKGTVWYDRLILGNFVEADGLVYPTFNRDKIVDIDNLDIDFVRYCIGVDVGTLNPQAYILAGITNDNKVYIIKEYYHDGRQTHKQKTNYEYAVDMVEFCNGYRIENIIVDPSAASQILQFKQLGLPVRKAENNVANGIRVMNTFFNTNRLFVDKHCVNFINEIENHTYTKDTELPDKTQPQHSLDACRYLCMYLNKTYLSMNF